MSKIPTLTNIDRAEPRHPEKRGYTATAATAVYPAGRPQQQHRLEARQKKIETLTLAHFTFVFRLKPRQKVVIRCQFIVIKNISK